jgi:hypothetical protein
VILILAVSFYNIQIGLTHRASSLENFAGHVGNLVAGEIVMRNLVAGEIVMGDVVAGEMRNLVAERKWTGVGFAFPRSGHPLRSRTSIRTETCGVSFVPRSMT